MKRITLLIVACVLMAVSAPAQKYINSQTRLDCYGKDGRLLRSESFSKYDFIIDACCDMHAPIEYLKFVKNADGTYDMKYRWTDDLLSRIEFVQDGVLKQPLNVTVSQPDMKVNWEVTGSYLDDDYVPDGEKNPTEVLSSCMVRFTLELPEGAYPTYSYFKDYVVSAFYPGTLDYRMLFCDRDVFDMDFRKKKYDKCMGYYGSFTRDEENPNVWYYTTRKYNKAENLEFSYIRPGNEMLKQAALNVASPINDNPDESCYYNYGESSIMTRIGDSFGGDMINWEFGRTPFSTITDASNWLTTMPWFNSERLITKTNLLLAIMDLYTGADAKTREVVTAQMLTLRSHAYWRLLQCYAPRWSESDNGSALCAPLETELNFENKAPATMLEILTQCYADLDRAMDIFSRTGYKRTYLEEPDLNVARMVKMRLAVLCEDWATARDMALLVTADKPLTTNAELTSGFFSDTDSWVWGIWNRGDKRGTQMYGHNILEFNACNLTLNDIVNAINRELYDKMDAKDVRRTMFVMPGNLTGAANEERFWYGYPSIFVEIDGIIKVDEASAGPIIDLMKERKPNGVTYPAFTSRIKTDRHNPIIFGAQTKFYYSDDNFFTPTATCFMRSDEAQLTLAEAYWHLNEMTPAREALRKLNSMRIDQYADGGLDGNALLEAIKLSRRAELWGEGHNWFDMKRWNMTGRRKAWVENDITSGNAPEAVAATSILTTTECNGWRFVVPSLVTHYNPLININKYRYEESTGYDKIPDEPGWIPNKPED